MKKPITFKIAAVLYLIGMCFGLVRDLLYKFSFELKPDFYYWNPFVLPILIIGVLIGYYLLQKGLNWVRIVSLVFYLFGVAKLLIFPNHLSDEMNFASILGILILISFLFRGISVYFLFTKEANLYLSTKKSI